ncbi:2-C-methyl-D-erythritol 4-phosphate cytidylyltransferase [Rothia terrae]|uniref:2-C-methyl-D-erythritol 4-phosphate cytidylyltransferase n=1 Tax=Rothia terrae TaxID=396015 RepID=UPI0028822503|nr:2-C-methyl-D-erythritol 4-phosphate cytidylyltransferase [Rothia terrae]MDT0189759.1 2-C-methyl-D-erythritol 4-phosphate cytidylyltransferase [Rothia terrae]
MSESKFLNDTAKTASDTEAVFAVIVVAAGSGSRLGRGIPKAAVEVAGKTLLQWALEGVIAAGIASRVVVTVPAGDTVLRQVCERFGALAVEGGATRSESVTAALSVLNEAPLQTGFSESPATSVLVHDAARCFTPVSSFKNVAEALVAGEKAVIPVVPVVDTIKSVDVKQVVTGTPARSELRAVQTPQGFDLATLLDAYSDLSSLSSEEAEAVTDDAMLIETLGMRVLTVAGHADAFKVTTPLDLVLAQALYEH